MILVTVGGQVAFDRLIRVVDAWAGEAGRKDVFCQILDGAYEPMHTEFERRLSPSVFQEKLLQADVVVAHAGMGTILGALEHEKPVLVMPRRAALGEQRNDHQLATASRFKEKGNVHVAMDESELTGMLGRVDELSAGDSIGSQASDELLTALREFAQG